MTPEDIAMIRQVLPEKMTFPYYADRESPWCLGARMAGDTKISNLRGADLAQFLNRPLVKPLVAASGDGVLRQRDVLALGHAERSVDWNVSRAGAGALEQVYGLYWHDFELSFTTWGEGAEWQWNQLSRRGGNLVVQLGFPSDHARLMGRSGTKVSRKDLEFSGHPIRADGRPTLAWVRVDVDLTTGVALIEEVQSDWLRFMKDELENLAPRSRALKQAQAYEAGLRARYGKIWQKAALLAALTLLRDEFACREIWIHQPKPGAVLKSIRWSYPPVSLYSTLPKSFGFAPTQEAPCFLSPSRRKTLTKLRKVEGPLFWRLSF